MKLTINLDEASMNGLQVAIDKHYQTCSLETVAGQLLTTLLKDMGYVTDTSQIGTLPENLNSSNDD